MTPSLTHAIAIARSGQRDQARTLLIQEVEADEHNQEAWLWLSGVVDDPEDIRVCLQNVLQLDPANKQAQKGLDWLDIHHAAAKIPAPQPGIVKPPEAHLAFTGDPEPQTDLPANTVATPASQTAEPSPDSKAEHFPCLYCGERAAAKHNRCPRCRRSLLARTAPNPNNGGWAMSILAAIWMIIPVILFASVVLFFFAGMHMSILGGGRAFAPSLLGTIIIGILFLVVAIPWFLIARGLYRRRKWAYILVALEHATRFLGTFIYLVFTLLSWRTSTLSSATSTREVWLFLVIGYGVALIWILGQIWLLFVGYPAVFGSKERVEYTVVHTDSNTHYNNGITLKSKGMWYAAALEWEAATQTDSGNPHYLHALGLAYAQVKQLEKGRATLAHALRLAPDDTRIQESHALLMSIK